jgi:hypothetical protein
MESGARRIGIDRAHIPAPRCDVSALRSVGVVLSGSVHADSGHQNHEPNARDKHEEPKKNRSVAQAVRPLIEATRLGNLTSRFALIVDCNGEQ